MEVVADPEIVGIAKFGRRRVLVLRGIGREQRLVGLQQRAADAPDDVAQRLFASRGDAAEQHARAGLDGFDLDAGLLGEGIEHQAFRLPSLAE